MATALAKGFLRSKGAAPSQIMASDLSEAARAGFVRETGAHASPSNIAVVQSSEVLFLAIKPGQVEEVLTEISGPFNEDHLLISIAAGVPLGRMQKILGPAARIIRVMPNTPALVGAGASAFAVGVATQPQDAELAQRLLATVGEAFQVKETLLDAVTGLSGSGPAYAFLLIEALSDGGVAAGLPPRRGHTPGGPDAAGQRADGAGNGPASRRAQRHGHQPRGHHHRGPA